MAPSAILQSGYFHLDKNKKAEEIFGFTLIFSFVGNTGFEPVTFSMSRKRANQLRQLPKSWERINRRRLWGVPKRTGRKTILFG